MVEKTDPERFRELLTRAQLGASRRVAIYEQLAGLKIAEERASR